MLFLVTLQHILTMSSVPPTVPPPTGAVSIVYNTTCFVHNHPNPAYPNTPVCTATLNIIVPLGCIGTYTGQSSYNLAEAFVREWYPECTNWVYTFRRECDVCDGWGNCNHCNCNETCADGCAQLCTLCGHCPECGPCGAYDHCRMLTSGGNISGYVV